MAKKQERIRAMIAQIDDIIQRALELEKQYEEALNRVHPKLQESARNLLHYRALRMTDISDLQKRLGNLGLSRLAKAEAHVMASLRTTRNVLEGFLHNKKIRTPKHRLSPKKSKRFHKSNAKALLGYRSKGRRARIMVTLPSEAAGDYSLVHELIARGMNCARINCAHDGPEAWKRMIDHVRRAAEKLNNQVMVCMDLGGPKIRTGLLEDGPKVRKYRPKKDVRGRIIEPLDVWVGPAPHPTLPHVPMEADHAARLAPGETLYFRDAREKKRSIRIVAREEEGLLGQIDGTTFLETNLLLFLDPGHKGPFVQVGELPAVEQPILLAPGDRLCLHADARAGAPARYDDDGACVAPAHLSCTSAEVFEQVQPGEPILFDDGKFEGVIREVAPGEMTVEILRTPPGGGKLRADKGINFPESALQISGLTDKDRVDLAFVARHADAVNVSFVNSARDVQELLDELDRLEARDRLGVILKIETQRGFNHLTEILLEAMQVYPIGLMIARGDLAIETGWQNIGRIQEELLFLCRAAHIPDIWATQVLENLAKRGIPSRAEITDATAAQRADCVMLNKGPYILQAVSLLDTILKDLAPYQDKNAPLFPRLEEASRAKRAARKSSLSK